MVERGGNVKAKSTSEFELAFRDFLKFVRIERILILQHLSNN